MQDLNFEVNQLPDQIFENLWIAHKHYSLKVMFPSWQASLMNPCDILIKCEQ